MLWIIIFTIIFIINVFPAFMPPTWLVLSSFAFYSHASNSKLFLVAIVGAIAATSGRILLAYISNTLIRNRFLSEKTIKNIDDIKNHIQNKQTITFGFFLFYAFSPLPSGQLFMSYGLTKLPIKLLAIPFFIGRLVSYTAWSLTASSISSKLASETLKSGAFFGSYFIFAQLATFIFIYLFTRINWHLLFTEKKLQLIK